MALLAEFFGGKPKVPAFKPINAQTIQQQTLTGNTAALPETIAQTGAINAAQFANIDKLIAQASGGVYGRLSAKALSNIENLLNGGKIDLSGTAAANLGRGTAGSPFGFVTAQNEAVKQVRANQAQGFDSLQRWLSGVNQTYQPVSVGAMFARNTYDLPTALAHATEERNAEFQRDYVKNQWDWYGSFGQQAIRFEDSVLQLAGDVAGAAMAASCWVAREVFGESDPRWRLFRFWLLTRAPSWFRNLYLNHGEKFAKWIHNKPILKAIIRRLMESRIATLEVSHGLV